MDKQRVRRRTLHILLLFYSVATFLKSLHNQQWAHAHINAQIEICLFCGIGSQQQPSAQTLYLFPGFNAFALLPVLLLHLNVVSVCTLVY